MATTSSPHAHSVFTSDTRGDASITSQLIVEQPAADSPRGVGSSWGTQTMPR